MECLKNNFHNGVLLNGRFQTISPLNHGSFGMVFSARDLQTDEIVAIKCMTKRGAVADPNFDLYYDEKSEELYCHRRLAAHPNIVNMIDTFETDAHLYLALEYCSQGDLYEAIRRGYGPLETEHVRDFMLELVDAVSYMHSQGIFHRDIKPENIFLSQTGSMKLGDFGLATTDKWSYESAVGSDRYMSPEQYDSAGAGYSPAQADIWAIGVCLLNILFSRNPFTTPTESDPLFLDFSRDKQSLFDVFPSMSQDTYEVIVQFMNLDPTKRSLVGAREALLRVVSFTTDDEALDDFCTAERAAIATANREPLRTPSLQSPHIEQGAFPWTKALHTGAKPIRQLSAIPDDESYTEELFPKSENTADWFSGSALTPSISSVLTSNLAASMNSLAISRPLNVPSRTVAPRAAPVAGSLPITMSKPRPTLNAMSLVFGREKEVVSKSWSDMWEEDLEEDEEEYARQLQALKELNSRTWSQESKTEDVDTLLGSTAPTPVPAPDAGLSPQSTVLDSFSADIDIDGDIVADGFFFEEHPVIIEEPKYSPSRYSPPAKRSGLDKWAELGERRRAPPINFGTKSPEPALKTQRHFGYDLKSSFGTGNALLDTTNQSNPKGNRDRAKSRGGCPWNHGRDWNWREKRNGFGDVEWVGHWQESH
ncbi:serine/threonine-protein kinase ksp1 [Microdochium bolleyi]|uniref:Serine/threonine-protein kinase ksp1 n=1 Tax=Microdochium bolleyi TaxID=196109 RepID=A0A136JAY1_9PEZI|nr:serine/threonine-protein kinase ksp1 [Microdochium bolleyi]